MTYHVTSASMKSIDVLTLTNSFIIIFYTPGSKGSRGLKTKKQKELEIWGKAQREFARRPKCDWGKLGGAKFPRHQSHVARTQMHWHTPNAHCRLRVGQH